MAAGLVMLGWEEEELVAGLVVLGWEEEEMAAAGRVVVGWEQEEMGGGRLDNSRGLAALKGVVTDSYRHVPASKRQHAGR